MFNLACDGASRSRPHEWFGAMVAVPDIVADRSHQLAHTAKGSSADALGGDFRKESFDQIQPGSTRRREMPLIARVRLKPSLHRGMGVGRIVVQDQMNR